MAPLSGEVPPWAVFVMFILLSAIGSLFAKFIFNRYSRLENRVDNTETKCQVLETELQRKADYTHLEKEVEKLADRNHSDLKDIQKQIAESMKTMHGRLDDLHLIFINFLNSNGKHDK